MRNWIMFLLVMVIVVLFTQGSFNSASAGKLNTGRGVKRLV